MDDELVVKYRDVWRPSSSRVGLKFSPGFLASRSGLPELTAIWHHCRKCLRDVGEHLMNTIDESWFSPDYTTARSRFVELVKDKGGQLTSLPIGALGPNKEPLSIDIGLFGDPTRNTFCSMSQAHGIEGFRVGTCLSHRQRCLQNCHGAPWSLYMYQSVRHGVDSSSMSETSTSIVIFYHRRLMSACTGYAAAVPLEPIQSARI